MKKRILFAFAILAVFGLAIAAFAYNRSYTAANADKASCCKKSDSCPMKGKMDHDKSGDHAKGEHHSCCGDSCPMKNKDANANAAGHSCGCCGDSCPMKKNGETKGTAVQTSDDGKKSCCDNCDCCKGKEKTTAV